MATYLLGEALDRPKITEPIYQFLEERCRQRIEYLISAVQAELVENYEIPISDADPLAPMLVMRSVGVNAKEQPIFQSLSAFPDKRVQLKLFRPRGRNRGPSRGTHKTILTEEL